MEESKGLIKKSKRGQAQTIISIVGLRHREDKREYQAKYVGGRLSEWMLLPDLLRTHAKSSTREGTQRSAIGEMVHQFDQDWAGSKNGGGDSDVEGSDVEEQFFRAALNASITDTRRLGREDDVQQMQAAIAASLSGGGSGGSTSSAGASISGIVSKMATKSKRGGYFSKATGRGNPIGRAQRAGKAPGPKGAAPAGPAIDAVPAKKRKKRRASSGWDASDAQKRAKAKKVREAKAAAALARTPPAAGGIALQAPAAGVVRVLQAPAAGVVRARAAASGAGAGARLTARKSTTRKAPPFPRTTPSRITVHLTGKTTDLIHRHKGRVAAEARRTASLLAATPSALAIDEGPAPTSPTTGARAGAGAVVGPKQNINQEHIPSTVQQQVQQALKLNATLHAEQVATLQARLDASQAHARDLQNQIKSLTTVTVINVETGQAEEQTNPYDKELETRKRQRNVAPEVAATRAAARAVLKQVKVERDDANVKAAKAMDDAEYQEEETSTAYTFSGRQTDAIDRLVQLATAAGCDPVAVKEAAGIRVD